MFNIAGDGEWLRRCIGFRVDIVDLADFCGMREASDRDVLKRIERKDLMTPKKHLPPRSSENIGLHERIPILRRLPTTSDITESVNAVEEAFA